MEKEVENLKKEVLILNERIKVLEGREHRRGIMHSIKLFVSIVVVLALCLLIWKAYDYITNYVPDYLEQKMTEVAPFES